jgi:hypothetical protein
VSPGAVGQAGLVELWQVGSILGLVGQVWLVEGCEVRHGGLRWIEVRQARLVMVVCVMAD